jgi:nicotinate-nucleotide pyrophosphorylase (carboxylating)
MSTEPFSCNAHDPVAIALAEDIGGGDVTSRFFVNPEQRGVARIIAKEDGAVLAGVETAAEVFSRVDAELLVTLLRAPGDRLAKGDAVLEVRGLVRPILTAERVALNFIQRLSGVATLTRRFVDAIAGTGAKILDTRKTTPGLRALEKAAVVAGGGVNHRFGLHDMAMVKDNHLAARDDVDFLQNAIRSLRTERPGVRVELEADTLEQARGFLGIEGVDVILLDNMPPEVMREAVRLGAGRVQFEASGGVTLESVRAIAESGVDFVSVGALTHSARSVDFSLDLEKENA